MKKHFLLLLLMTLLPLAGWAVERITVTLGTINKVYGEADPGVTALDFSWTTDGGGTTTEVNATNLLAALDYRRVSAGDEVNSVKYYTMVANNHKPDDWILVIANQGVINIMPKSLGTGTDVPLTGISIADITGISYTGQAQTPNLLVHYDGALVDEDLVKDRDYTVEFTDNINKGTATATLTGIGNYEGTVIKTFEIGAGQFTVAFAQTPEFTYNGEAQVPTYTVMLGETALEAGTDYDVHYYSDEARTTEVDAAEVKDASTYYVKVVGKTGTNYDGSVVTATADETPVDLNYTIAKKSLADEDVTAVVKSDYKNKTYKGSAYTFVPANLTVKAYVGTGNELTLNSTMYDREGYENNIDVPAADAADDQKPRFKVVGKGNFTGERYVYFNIVPRPLDDVNVNISDDLVADQPYTGLKITPSTEGKITYNTQILVEGEDKDYTVAYGENKNVVKEEGVVANGGTITITGTGNYSGTVEKSFKITPAVLTVNAKNFSKNLGTVDPTSDELAAGNYYEIIGYVNEETAETAHVTGAPTFAISDHPETTGTHANVISISAVIGLSAANYSFVVGAAANLIIGQGSVTVAATDTEKTYGYKLPALDKDAFGFTATGLVGAETITGLTFTVTNVINNNVVEYHAGDMLEAGEYTITPSAATATSDSYVFEYTPATLTINPYKLTIAAQDQAIDYGTAPVLCPTSWANTYVRFLDADGNTIGKTDFEALYGVWKEDFIENTEWVVADNHPLAEPGTIKVNLKADYDSKNFEVETVVGNVTYNALGGLVLTSTDADLAAIRAEHGNNVNVKIDFSLRNNRELPAGTTRYWKGGEWNTLTLPFDITVAELSQILGYAIVNEIDPSGYNESSGAPVYKFKLTMKGAYGKDYLPANKPFVIKTTDDIVGVKDFGTQTIKAPTDDDLNGVDAGGGSMFKPAYAEKEVTSADNGKIWFLLGNHTKWAYINPSSSNTWTILPLESYIDQSGNPANASNAIFMMEDLDGTTAIHGINVDDAENAKLNSAKGWYNLNGVKMENAPAMKGVYIKDGKKVVIK